MADETVRACPHCGESSLQYCRRAGAGTRMAAADDPHWICHKCGDHVDEPVEREPRKPTWSGHEKLRRAGFAHLLDDGGEAQ